MTIVTGRAVTNFTLSFMKVRANKIGGGTDDAVVMKIAFDDEELEFLMSPASARIAAYEILGKAGEEKKPQ